MFKVLTFFPILAMMISVMLPPVTPYVTIKGSDRHERIWLWRVPAYADHPAWHIRWTWRDGLTARTYCYDPEESARYRITGDAATLPDARR